MTDQASTPDPELAARLARLQSRRSPAAVPTQTHEMMAVPQQPASPNEPTSNATTPSADVPGAPVPSQLPRPRRAVGTKIGTLGASLTAMFGLMALYGVAEQRNNLNQPDPDPIGFGQPGAAQTGLTGDFGGAASQGDLAGAVPANLVSEPSLPNEPALVVPGLVDSTPNETVPVEALHAVVVVDEAGNVLSAPDGLDPALISAAIAEHQQGQDPSSVVVATTAPVAQPVAVDLAIPEPPPPPRRRSSGGGGGGGGGGSSSGGSSSRASAPAPAPAPQAQSSGS